MAAGPIGRIGRRVRTRVGVACSSAAAIVASLNPGRAGTTAQETTACGNCATHTPALVSGNCCFFVVFCFTHKKAREYLLVSAIFC